TTPSTETCDGIDNDGDGLIDEGFDEDGDGYPPCGSEWDCDDDDAFIYPGALDVCDGIDNDCSGAIDEDFDEDGDGDSACGSDCDDSDPATSGHLPEICDGVDNNCDGIADEGFDADADGFTTCAGDCDDANADTFPGAPEVCDGQVNGCGEEKLDETVDADGDGLSICDGDCDDTEAASYAGAEEICDRLDNDCNGETDEHQECYGCTTSDPYLVCTDALTWADASEACTTFGYHLVTIDDATENSAVAALYSSTFWIGFNDHDSEGDFVWEDGSAVTFTSWGSGEPNDSSNEDCTHTNWSSAGIWNDYDCSNTEPFVCE
ncbi:MAG: hypothetical protein ACI8RZ_000512, partial [Myxococcota bacterium]